MPAGARQLDEAAGRERRQRVEPGRRPAAVERRERAIGAEHADGAALGGLVARLAAAVDDQLGDLAVGAVGDLPAGGRRELAQHVGEVDLAADDDEPPVAAARTRVRAGRARGRSARRS